VGGNLDPTARNRLRRAKHADGELGNLVAGHIEHRLLAPERLKEVLASVHHAILYALELLRWTCEI
jgi:hypothetical protein